MQIGIGVNYHLNILIIIVEKLIPIIYLKNNDLLENSLFVKRYQILFERGHWFCKNVENAICSLVGAKSINRFLGGYINQLNVTSVVRSIV